MRKLFILTSIWLVCMSFASAQITGNLQPCPNVTEMYSVNIPSSCINPKWEILNNNNAVTSNGDIGTLSNAQVNSNGTASVNIVWRNDQPGGRLRVTFVDGNGAPCGSISPLNIEIKAIGHLTPTITSTAFNYCTNSINLTVSNHSGFKWIRANTPYQWSLPAGWVITSANPNAPTITVALPNGCVDGTVSVVGRSTLECLSLSDHFSKTGTINLTRSNPNIAIEPPSPGYKSNCGKVGEVTFRLTGTLLTCATQVVWTVPSGYSHPNKQPNGTIVVTNSRNLTLTPSGSTQDAGNISARVVLNCGSLDVSPYNVTFDPTPEGFFMSGPTTFCSTATYSVPPLPGSDATYNWNVGNFRIISGQGTNTITIDGLGANNITLTTSSTQCGALPIITRPVVYHDPAFQIPNAFGLNANEDFNCNTRITTYAVPEVNEYVWYSNKPELLWAASTKAYCNPRPRFDETNPQFVGRTGREAFFGKSVATLPHDTWLAVVSVSACGQRTSDLRYIDLTGLGAQPTPIDPNPPTDPTDPCNTNPVPRIMNGNLEMTVLKPYCPNGKAMKEVVLYNDKGKIIYRQSEFTEETLKWDVNRLRKGLYILKYQTEQGIETKKIVIE